MTYDGTMEVASFLQAAVITFTSLLALIFPPISNTPLTTFTVQFLKTTTPEITEEETKSSATSAAIIDNETTTLETPSVLSSPSLTKSQLPTGKVTPTLVPTRIQSLLVSSPTPTKKPMTPTPIPTKSPTPMPTKTPTPTKVPMFVPLTPLTQIATPASSLNADVIFEKVNAYRQSRNLSVLQKDTPLCTLAAVRATEIYNEIFYGVMHAGLYNRNLPYRIVENIAHFQTEESMVAWWIRDFIHRKAIEGNYTYTCVSCSGKSCTQLFTNYEPR